jgi:hypothetical protein
MQVVISPQSLLETGIRVEKVDDLRLFKFTDDLQDKLEGLLEKNQVSILTAIEPPFTTLKFLMKLCYNCW